MPEFARVERARFFPKTFHCCPGEIMDFGLRGCLRLRLVVSRVLAAGEVIAFPLGCSAARERREVHA